MALSNGNLFSTVDRDNDSSPSVNCAVNYGRGGWWYGRCGHSNLNGVYHYSPRTKDRTGIFWWNWYDVFYSMKATTMMVQKT